MHLRVKFLCWRPGEIRPGDVVHPEVVGAVGGVPNIVTVCPGQDAGEGGVEVEERPRDDGVVVEGDIQGDDADGVSYTWGRDETEPSPTGHLCLDTRSPDFPPLSSSVSRLAFKNGTDVFPYGNGSGSVELSQRQFHVKERHPTKDGHQNIGNEEGTCGERSESSNCFQVMVGVGAFAVTATEESI